MQFLNPPSLSRSFRGRTCVVCKADKQASSVSNTHAHTRLFTAAAAAETCTPESGPWEQQLLIKRVEFCCQPSLRHSKHKGTCPLPPPCPATVAAAHSASSLTLTQTWMPFRLLSSPIAAVSAVPPPARACPVSTPLRQYNHLGEEKQARRCACCTKETSSKRTLLLFATILLVAVPRVTNGQLKSCQLSWLHSCISVQCTALND